MRWSIRYIPLIAVIVPCLVVAAIWSTHLRADPANPLAQNAGNTPSAAPATSFTVPQLGDALSSYNKNTITDNGQTVYSVNVPKGKWNLNIIISLSPNGTVIWMTNGLTQMPDAKKINTDTLLSVLKKNTEIGPMFFSIAGDGLRMNYPVANYGLTADGLKKQIEAMAQTVVDTEALWSPDSLSKPTAPTDSATPSK